MRTTNTQQTSSQARLLATDVPTGSNSWAENNTQVCKQNLEPDGTTSKTWSTEQRADQMLLLLLALLGNGLQSQPVQLGPCSCCWWSLFRPALVQQGINRPLVYHWPEQHINLFTLGSWFLQSWSLNSKLQFHLQHCLISGQSSGGSSNVRRLQTTKCYIYSKYEALSFRELHSCVFCVSSNKERIRQHSCVFFIVGCSPTLITRQHFLKTAQPLNGNGTNCSKQISISSFINLLQPPEGIQSGDAFCPGSWSLVGGAWGRLERQQDSLRLTNTSTCAAKNPGCCQQ